MSRSHQTSLLDTAPAVLDGAAGCPDGLVGAGTAQGSSGAAQGSSGAVLRAARAAQRDAETAQVRLLESTLDWVAMHSADHVARPGRFRPVVPVAGAGAPLVEDLAIDELVAVLGMSPAAGRAHVAAAVELRYRLPRLYAAVIAGRVPVWRARRVAETTMAHTVEVAGFVDRHVTPVAGTIGVARLDALVEEAIWRTDPDTAERIAHDAEHELDERRHVSIDRDQVTYSGTVEIRAEVDMLDAYDLDDALTRRAAAYKSLGSTAALGARRAAALGDLARADLTLDLMTEAAEDAGAGADGTTAAGGGAGADAESVGALTRRASGRRGVNLYLHLTLDQLHGSADVGIGRAEHLRGPVPAELIRDWCGRPTVDLRVVPVIDLADHVHVDAYEIPDRITERVALRDHHCVFPHCTRPARRLAPDRHATDCDHITAYDPGAPDSPGSATCTCNLAPLCRRHHRLKTHTGWTYTPITPGTYAWTSPHGHHWMRDHHGTHDLDPPSPPEPPG
ncbi:HNH endonuclease signature motif containing protein [Nocardioides alkalitolerans]|uniref:HNH endonuclease signature motif containing protein n=1 Tax=Nocardioides alkalitolerans TaxID=281714 RepID=UPI0003F6E39E|nr:HNH endonuclease signature motif containing protein [Nocardioides alkalitolerans]